MDLDARKRDILQAVVHGYVETAEPIGSEWLASRYDFGCRSATLRNEMADIAERGYLLKPHTSAGRIPTDLGYRYYVDRLMRPAAVRQPADAAVFEAIEGTGLEVEDIVQRTCRLLADMTECLSVATPPLADCAYLHRLYVTQASPHHLLVVLLLSTGHVEHRVLDVDVAPPERTLARATAYLNTALSGREVAEIGGSVLAEVPPEIREEQSLVRALFSTAASAAAGLADDRLFLEGTSHILRQREFHDVLRLEQLFSALQRSSVLAQVFRSDQPGYAVRVVIGRESSVDGMQDCSVVTTRYLIRDRTGGFIGVVGPTRMEYSRAVAAVGMMARTLSDVLTRASLG